MIKTREHKTVFHGGYSDEKPIMTFGYKVNSPAKLKELDNVNKSALIEELETFSKRIVEFINELKG